MFIVCRHHRWYLQVHSVRCQTNHQSSILNLQFLLTQDRCCHLGLCHPTRCTSSPIWRAATMLRNRVHCHTAGLSDTAPNISMLNQASLNATSSDWSCYILCQETCTTIVSGTSALDWYVVVSRVTLKTVAQPTIHLIDHVVDRFYHSLEKNWCRPFVAVSFAENFCTFQLSRLHHDYEQLHSWNDCCCVLLTTVQMHFVNLASILVAYQVILLLVLCKRGPKSRRSTFSHSLHWLEIKQCFDDKVLSCTQAPHDHSSHLPV